MEIWKPIPGFENCGDVSNLGRVRSSSGVIRKVSINNSGYVNVGLHKDHNGKNKLVQALMHRLVAKAFCEGYVEGYTVNHIDGNKTNNIAENLEWITLRENINHAYALNLRKTNHRKPLIPHEDVDKILQMVNSGYTQRQIANLYNVKQSSLSVYLKKYSGRLPSVP